MTHTCTRHRPGTTTCYSHHGCRCRPCTTAHSRDYKQWKWAAHNGTRGSLDPTGTRRRLQALQAAGWSQRAIADRLDMQRTQVEYILLGRGQVVFASTAARIATLYDELWDATPTQRPGSVSRTRGHAQREGWPPPLAWDDGYGPHGIDNPTATPHPWKRTESSRTRGGDIVELVEAGVSLAGLIERRISPDGADAALRRAGRHDLAAQIRPLGLTHANQYTKEAA